MILHLVKCEMCDKQFEFNPMVHPSRREAPDGWLVLFDAHEMQTQDGRHFCSLHCLVEWAAKVEIPAMVESPFIRREEVPA